MKSTEIKVDILSVLALKYLNSHNIRDRSIIFEEIADVYKPKMNNYCSKHHISGKDKEDFIQIYHLQILIALNKWSREKSNFGTYLYNYLLAVPRVYMNDSQTFKKGIVCISLESIPDNLI